MNNHGSIQRSNSVLILNPLKYDKTKSIHDFAGFNAKLIANFFSKSYVFYFYDSILRKGIKKTENQIKNLIKENNISIVFFAPHGSNYELPVEFFKDLRDELRVENVLFILDDEMIFDTLSRYYAQAFDAVITNDYYATFAYRKLGLLSLWYYYSGYGKDTLYPVAIDKDIDVSFVGDCTKADRIAYIKFLRENGIKVKTFGKDSENGIVKIEDLSEIFSRTKINLNFTKVDRYSIYAWFLEDNTITNLVRQSKGRLLEIAMTNSFCLSEYFASVEIPFEVGKEADVFYDKNELLEKIKFYLENEEARIQIANNAYKKVINNYEGTVFMPKLLKNLCDLLNNHKYLPKEGKIFKDSIFKKNHINQLTFIMFYQLLKLKFRPALETFINLFQYGFGIFLISFFKGTKRAILRICVSFKKNHA